MPGRQSVIGSNNLRDLIRIVIINMHMICIKYFKYYNLIHFKHRIDDVYII